jgi:RND family efflux transporter MFP subunit
MKFKYIAMLVVIAGVAVAAWFGSEPGKNQKNTPRRDLATQAAPVEVAPIEHGIIVLQRTFSGALEAPAQFLVAPKVSGRVERLAVNLADRVSRGQVVAELDNAEYVQAVAQAKAELAVAEANLAEADSALQIANRELERATQLRQRGVASESNLDTARANQLARQAQLEVAKAGVTKAQAALEAARIRLGYTRISADWSGNGTRVVAERYIDEGETVAANAPLLRIVVLDPLTAVIFVSETDYSKLQPAQPVTLTTDAYPGESFTGHIERIAPVFRESTRQARVEVTASNPGHRLKPGMFVRATVELDRATDALIVPEQALTKRDDRNGVFVVNTDGTSVSWQEVTPGIRANGRVQLLGQEGTELSGRVVTLGQQLVSDGSPIIIPAARTEQATAEQKARRP